MSLLAEQLVEEWLNRNGYFTMRGVRVGVDEIDLLAIRPIPNGGVECRHIEVQVSINPISYVTKVPVALRKQFGTAPHNAKKRDPAQLAQGVREWIAAKFDKPRKAAARTGLCDGCWSKELVVGRIKYEEELSLLRDAGVTIHRLRDILVEMAERESVVRGATGADLLDLIRLAE